MENIFIDKLHPSDWGHIKNICKDIFELSPYRVDRNFVKTLGENPDISEVSISILESATSINVVSLGKNQIVGFLAWTFEKTISEITGRRFFKINLLGVKKEFQRRGIGKALLEYSINEIKRLGGYAIQVSTDVNNFHALKLYQKSGFRVYSSTTTLRKFDNKYKPIQVDNIYLSHKPKNGDLHFLIQINEDYSVYNSPVFFYDGIENKYKLSIHKNYLQSLERNIDIFRVTLAYYQNKPVGYIIFKEDIALTDIYTRVSSTQRRAFRIFDIFVLDDYRNMNIGKMLIGDMISRIKENNMIIEVQTPSHNYSFINALMNQGFKISHVMVNLFL